MSQGASSSGGQQETTVVDEIPESLNRILLMILKNFYSHEQFLIVYYIMRAQCIREENLKNRLLIDQKTLRQQLAGLKQEKLVKERLFSQKNDHNNRTTSIIFYFINYRAVLNVIRYKIDHMRQKLEAREQMSTNQNHYKCNSCGCSYNALDITMIIDPEHPDRLTCWRCRGEVTPDESMAPSQATRTAVARFNEQMTPLYSQIAALGGIQLAPHLLEPDISKYLEDDKARELQLQQQLDFTSGGGGNRIQLGGTAHSFHNAATINYQHGDQVTVDLNADINNRPVEEAKQVPLWLQDNAIGGEAVSHNEQILSQVNDEEDDVATTTSITAKRSKNDGITMKFLKEIEFSDETSTSKEPQAKRMKLDGENGENAMETDEKEGEEEEEEEEEEMICVGGRTVPLSQVTARMVEEEMDAAEQQHYTQVVQELFAY
ncbi:unnamed protein product [Caenorhabditis sp. 36 PRJEB53466]|nr:unnamed protein product [Caenorhabditis sp. 36 PRJEB53466]